MNAVVTVLPGDGIGPEVTAQAVRVLRSVAERGGHGIEIREALIGGAAIDATGAPLPERTVALCRSSDAVLLGAVGGHRWDGLPASVRPEQGLLAIRKELGLFANVRPVRPHPVAAAASPLRPERLDGVDLIVVRELTGGIYFGEKRREPMDDGGERATDVCEYTSGEVERVVRVAAELARTRRGRLTSVDKANVLETSRLWRVVASRVVAEEFPDVELEHLLVDACAMHLLRRPADFDVIVTENMFGDILTDEASMLAGSMGLLASASLGAGAGPGAEPSPAGGAAPAGAAARAFGLYEPIHGSAPDIAGQGVANPIGAILSVAMLLRHSLGLAREAAAVEEAVDAVLAGGPATRDLARPGAAAASTSEVGRAVADLVAEGPGNSAVAPPAPAPASES